MAANLQSYKVAFQEDPASSTKFNNLVQAIEDALNALGDSTKTAFAQGQILAPSQLKQEGASQGQAVIWNGTQWAPANPGGTVYRKVTEKDVTNTTVETDLLNSEITIPAGVMGVNKMIRATLFGDFLNNTGSRVGPTVRIKLGSTILYGDDVGSAGSNGLASSGTRYAWQLTLHILNLGSATSQWMTGWLGFGQVATPTIQGLGVLDGDLIGSGTSPPNGRFAVFTLASAASVDTAQSQLLAVTVQFSTASTALSWRLKGGIVEIV